MNWLTRLSQKQSTLPPLQAPNDTNIEQVVMRVVRKDGITLQEAAKQLAGNPKSCDVINAIYPQQSNDAGLEELARMIGCHLRSAGQNLGQSNKPADPMAMPPQETQQPDATQENVV